MNSRLRAGLYHVLLVPAARQYVSPHLITPSPALPLEGREPEVEKNFGLMIAAAVLAPGLKI
jgi:hypothetical protein